MVKIVHLKAVNFNLCVFQCNTKIFQNNLQVSYMKDTEGALVSQLSLVETLWTEELKILQASAETLNSLQTACT